MHWKWRHYVHFSAQRNWISLLAYPIEKDVTMCIFRKTKKNLHVLVGLPWWKGVTMSISTKNWVSLLAYPIENDLTMCNFAKQIACPCWSTLVKGRHYVHFLQTKTCMFLLADLIKSGVTMCIFCKQLLAFDPDAKDVTMCIFCKRKLCVLVSLPYWKGRYYVHFLQTKLHVFIGLPY